MALPRPYGIIPALSVVVSFARFLTLAFNQEWICTILFTSDETYESTGEAY